MSHQAYLNLKLHRAIPLVAILALATISMPLLHRLSVLVHAPVPRLIELVAVPTVVGTLIGEAFTSPMALLEASGPRNHRAINLIMVIGVLGVAVALTSFSFGSGDNGRSWISLARNLFGQTGSATLSAAIWGGQYAFTFPMFVGVGAVALAGAGATGAVGWMIALDGDLSSHVIAGVLLIAGLIVFGARSPVPRLASGI